MAGKKKTKVEVELGGKFKTELAIQIDAKAAAKKDTEIRKLLTERVALKEEMRPTQLKVKAASEKIETLRQEVESLTEMRQVPCREERDFVHRVVRVRRLDTNAFVKDLERTMEDSDRQESLLAAKAPKKGKRAKGAKTDDAAHAAEKELTEHYNDRETDEIPLS